MGYKAEIEVQLYCVGIIRLTFFSFKINKQIFTIMQNSNSPCSFLMNWNIHYE